MDWYFRRDDEDDDLTVPNSIQSSDRLYADDEFPSCRNWFEMELERENFIQPDKSCPKTTNGDRKSHAHPNGDILLSDLPDHPLQSSLERMDFWDSGFMDEMFPRVEKFSSYMLDDQDDYHSLNYPSMLDDDVTDHESHETMTLPRSEEETFPLQEEEASKQAKTLHELERLLSQQLEPKTRLCFRDALYRLAETSEHHHPFENKKRKCDGSSAERETNAIDRAVASMMFRNMVLPGPPPF